MAPKPFTSHRRDPAREHTLGETVAVMVGLSLLPLAAFLAVAFPVAALTTVGAGAATVGGLAVGPTLAARVRSHTTGRRVCVPATDRCVDV